MGTVTKEEALPAVEDGVYEARLIDVLETSHPQYGEGLKFVFEIEQAPYAGSQVSILASTKLTPDNKLDRILQGLGATVGIGEQIDPTELIGRKCRVTVETKKKPGSDKVFSNVTKVMVPKRVPSTSALTSSRQPAKPSTTSGVAKGGGGWDD